MKKVLIPLAVLLILSVIKLSAQNNQHSGKPFPGKKLIRCATMENLAVWKKTQGSYAKTVPQTATGNTQSTTTSLPETAAGNVAGMKETGTNTTIYVPVVVHIILPDASVVSDADVIKQIQILNTDFAGLNADSSGIPASFKPLFAKSNIQFVLARKDPNGNLTSGIERRNNNLDFDPNSYPDAVKFQTSGGLSAWDATKYYNVWVANNSNGILGYATFPGTETNADQGAVINFLSWGTNPCYVYEGYDLGRTLVHETGHYFGLFHIWGDDEESPNNTANDCDGDDFKQLGGDVLLPTGLYNKDGDGNTVRDIGDTPNMGISTGDCPTGAVTDACTTTAAGRLYQDYMDYTQDACYRLFTKKQAERMEWIINNGRASLLTSDRGTAPAGLPSLDIAATSFINPGGSETISCVSRSYVSELQCAVAFQPKCIVTNKGTTTLTAIKADLKVNGQTVSTLTASVNLKTTESAVLTFPAFTPATGDNVFSLIVSSPNNAADQNILNDTAQTVLKVSAGATLPFTEGFEGTTFPPSNWIIAQSPEDDITWQRTTAAHKSGVASAYMNNYNYQANDRVDELISPLLNYSNADSVFLKFDVAAATVSDPATGTIPVDTLAVLISTDCGATYQQVYKKWGSALVTVPGALQDEFFPTSAQWRTDSVNITAISGTEGSMIVKFKNTENFENNLFIDNINIYTRTLPALLKKNGYLVYPNPFSSQVIVQHLQQPDNLRGINVYSASGQLVYQKSFSGSTASTYITLNLSAVASGVYIMRLIYTDKQTTQKLIKVN